MQIFDAIILGTIQGIAEFFPVSSTAHVAVISKLCSFNNCGKTFDVMLNLGTLLAIMAYFYRECLQLIRGGIDLLRFRDSTDKQFFLTIFFANVPVIVIFGIAELIKFEINSWVITGINLIVFGIILYFCDQKVTIKKNITKSDAFIVGISQLLSFMPGVSRLGICLSVCRYQGYARWESFKFSMLLSLIPVAGACALKLISIITNDVDINSLSILVGIISSFVFGIITLKFISYFLKTNTFTSIVVYRIIFGIIILVILR